MNEPVLVKGSDDVLREQAVADVVAGRVGDDDRTLLLAEFAGTDYELAAAVDAANTPPFLTDRRVVVIRHLGRFATADLASLVEYLGDPLDTTALVLVWERSPEPGSTSRAVPAGLSKAVSAAGGEVVTADAPTGRGRESWVAEWLSAHDLRLDAAARRRVVEQLGDDPGALVELGERLRGAFGTDGPLGADDLEPFLGQAGGVPPWELTDAIDAGDATTALAKLERMLDGGGRHPLQILATLQSHFGRMLRLDGAEARGEKDAAVLLGLRGSTYPAKKALAQTRRLGGPGVRRGIGLLAEADLALRGSLAWPEGLVMEVLVARLARLSRPTRR